MQNYKEVQSFTLLRSTERQQSSSKFNRKFIYGLLTLTILSASALYMITQQNQDPQKSIEFFENQSEQDVLKEYVNFIAKYQKTYASKHEASQRYEVFKTNFYKILHHNQRDDAPFEMEVNKFADMSDEEFEKSIQGLIINKERSARIPPVKQLKDHRFLQTENLPEYVNWYKEGKVSRPYNQASCGSCWAFTTAATLESLSAIYGNDTEVQEFSVQQLVDCDELDLGCQGGWMWQGYNYTKNYGLALKSTYARPYSAKKGTCSYHSGQAYFKPENLGMIEQDGNTNEQIKALVSKQPIAVAIFATGMLARFKGGIATEDFLKCSGAYREVNHGVTLVGYGKVDQKNDRVRGSCKEYWIIRNSWGADWGEEGHFRLCMDGPGEADKPYGSCLINKFATWPNLEGVVIEPL